MNNQEIAFQKEASVYEFKRPTLLGVPTGLGGVASFAAVLVLGCLIGRTDCAAGDVYQFIDSAGVVHFSNVPVDPRYRQIRVPVPVAPVRLEDIHETILSAARRYRVDPALVKAVIKVESDFDPHAVSDAGAMGLMQLMPATASTLDVQNPFNPAENISGGVKHLSYLLGRFNGDLTLALAAYHAGEKTVTHYNQVPPIEKTHRYIQKVLAAYKTYRGKESARKSIYKVLSPDGRVIYTNVPEQYQDTRRYRVAYTQAP
ncbi:MAG TPA: lytic transglycosylase domain-containing protein [Nitrospiria bacterium]|nr:lytic transglycosylase domain-containing protein [Nitrospiria bacterium]